MHQLRSPAARALAAALFLSTGGAATAQASATGLTLPGGYDSNVFYGGFTTPITALTKDPAGVVTGVTIDGVIRRLFDADQDGVCEATQEFWSGAGLLSVTDALWVGTSLYVCHLGAVTRIDDTNADGVGDAATNVVTGLPVGFHQNNGLLPDGPNHLLVTMGSATDLGPEPNATTASILRLDLTTGATTVHVSGVRNCYRLRRHPVTGDLYGGDNEWNAHPTQALVGDEFNVYLPGFDYGYPNHFGAAPVGQTSVPPVVQLPTRLAPTGFRFNPNTLISGYRDEVFLTLFSTGVGRVARLPIWFGPASGYPAGAYEEFASGFANPIDVEFAADGAMLVADFSTSTIHRIYPKHGCTLSVAGPPSVGTTVAVTAAAPAHPNQVCFMAASDFPYPSYALAPGMDFYLNTGSWLFWFSLTPGNGVFNFPVPAVLNGLGETTATIAIPNQPILAGFRIYLAAVVLDGSTGAPLAASPEQSLLVIPYY